MNDKDYSRMYDLMIYLGIKDFKQLKEFKEANCCRTNEELLNALEDEADIENELEKENQEQKNKKEETQCIKKIE